MDQLTAVSEEDMFFETQTQEQTELGSDEMYISLVQAIAVKKCRIVQKKEKIKLALQTLKKLNIELEVSRKESESLKKEREEICNQLNLKALNLKGAEDYRTSLETVLCNLKGRVSNLEKETKEKKNKFSAAIENAKAKWESYKEMYEEFPLAKKRKEFIIELKKADIELRKTEFDIEDLKLRKKLKAEIAEKQYRLSCVKLARAFLTRKEKIAEINVLSVRISELRKRLEDRKVGTFVEDHTIAAEPAKSSLPNQGKQKATKSNFLQFNLPQFPLSPPQLDIENEPPKTGLSSWKSLFSSVNLLNISRKFQTIQGRETKIPEEQSAQQLSRTLTNLYQKKSNSEIDKINVSNSLSKSMSNESKQIPAKRKYSSQNDELTKNQINQEPPKKVRFLNSLLGGNDPVKYNANINLVGKDSRATSENVQKADEKLPNKSNLKINKTEMIKNAKYPSLSFSSNPLAITKKMPLSQNVTTLRLSENQQKSFEPHMNTVAPKLILGSNNIEKEQSIHQTPVNQDAVDLFADEDNENRLDNLTLSMVPTPPDVIPVDNNSQPLSHPDSGTFRSLSSEFLSPSDLDESAKLHYQRIAAESPEFIYPKGPELMKSQKGGTEESEVVQSHYFTNMPQQKTQAVNLEKQIPQEEGYHTPYSPPVHINLGSDPDVTTNVPSPVSEGLGFFGFGEKPSSEKQLFNQPSSSEGNKSPEAQFGFNFMSNPTKKSSFFSLF